MEFIEILKMQSLSEEQIKVITKAMMKNRIFITKEEKIEERYQKMKSQRDSLKQKLDLALDMAIQGQLANVMYPELLICKFDKSKLSIDTDGKMIGFEEQLFAIRRTYPDLFPGPKDRRQNGAQDTSGKRNEKGTNIVMQNKMKTNGEEVNMKHDK